MSYFSPVRREIDRLLAEFRKRVPTFTHLPYMVMSADWSGEDGRPAPGEWAKMERGELEVHDAPGHEEANQMARQMARGHGMQPKLYLWDPSDEGTEP